MIGLLGQVPTEPSSYSSMAVVASVVAFLLWRMKSTDAADRKRIDDCEARIAVKDAVIASKDDEIKEQRSQKHAAINREARAQGTLDVVKRLVPACTCGSLDPLKSLLNMTEDP